MYTECQSKTLFWQNEKLICTLSFVGVKIVFMASISNNYSTIDFVTKLVFWILELVKSVVLLIEKGILSHNRLQDYCTRVFDSKAIDLCLNLVPMVGLLNGRSCQINFTSF